MIAIFAGHVGKDTGAVICTGDGGDYNEATVNYAISLKIVDMLSAIGIESKIIMGTFENRLRGSKGCNMGVSIHADTCNDKDVRGAHVMYYPGSVNGEKLALNIANSMYSCRITKARKPHAEDFFILRKTAFPCVLIETGFLTNLTDRKLLFSSEYQYKIAHAIVAGMGVI